MADRPFLLMVAGPNGSGKTTLTRQLTSVGVDLGVYINPDDIALTLDGDYDTRVRRAQAIADEERSVCLRDGVSFSFETVMSHPSKIEVLEAARRQGFAVVFYFVATESPDLNVARVRQRVMLGEHDVPEEKIRARYVRSLALLPQAIALADDVVLFDNSFGRGRRGPARLRPFCRLASGKFTLAPPIPKWASRALRGWLPSATLKGMPK